MATDNNYYKIKGEVWKQITGFLKSVFWPIVDVINVALGDAAFLGVDNSVTKSSNNAVKSGGVYDEVHPAYGSSQPSGGMLPNVLYKLGTLTGAVTISLATPSDGAIENEYKFSFSADSTAPTITWDNAITEWKGNCLDSNGQPVMTASKSYEISVEDGLGIIIEW